MPLLLLAYIDLGFTQVRQIDSVKTELLDEIVISAQFTPRSEKNSIYKVRVLNKRTISRRASNNLKELLQHELNINLSQNSVFGSSIELQGISKENIKILIDGTPVIGRLNGILDLSQINLANIERLEIIEGPVSVFYGTDAMGGVINLISKKNQKNILDSNFSLYYESINAVNINGHIGYRFGKNIIQLGGSNYRFKGLSTNNASRTLNWEKKNQYFTNFSYTRTTKNLQFQFKNNFSREKLRAMGEPDRQGNIKDKDYYTRRFNNILSMNGKIFRNKFIDVKLSYLDYQRYHNTFDINPITFVSVPASVDNKDDNIVKLNYMGFRTQLGKNDSEKQLNYTVGTDLKIESTKGKRILDKKQTIQTYALFGSINYKLFEGFEIQPAVRYTYNNKYGFLISPAFNSRLKIDNFNSIRFSYAQGFRSPSLKELFLDFHKSAGPYTYVISGNERLKVEKSHSFNLQYSYHRIINKLESIDVEPSVFYNDISGLIALSEMVNFHRYYINIDRFKSLGCKVDFSYKNTKNIAFRTGVALIGRYNKLTENFDSARFLYTPEITSSLSYKIYKLETNLNLFYKYTGKKLGFFVDSGNNLVRTTRDDFSNFDMNVSKSFFTKKLDVSLGVKNIFDVKDIEILNRAGNAHTRDMQLWGRSFFIKTICAF